MATKKKVSNKKQMSEHKKALLWAIEDVTPQLVLAIACVVLGAALTAVCFTGYGIKVGRETAYSYSDEPNSTDVSIIDIDYSLNKFDYAADSDCLHGDSSEKCLLNSYGATSENYAVITSSDQLERLMNTLNNITGQNFSMNIDSKFFNSGSIIAIVDESGVYDFTLNSVYRDENYGLHFQTNSIRTDDEFTNTGHLLLVRVPNIQTKDITVKSVEKE